MTGYVALLRGINVGGHKKIPMERLRDLFTELGYTNARTYIQSGNIVFAAPSEPSSIHAAIESGIADRFGFPVPVVLRSRRQLDTIVEACPFAKRDLDPAKLTVTFLAEPIPERVRSELVVPDGLVEEAVATAAELYIHYPDGQGRSKLDRSGFWNPLKGSITTTRNWRTVVKLRDMLAAAVPLRPHFGQERKRSPNQRPRRRLVV